MSANHRIPVCLKLILRLLTQPLGLYADMTTLGLSIILRINPP
jgi:hypothetical protein